MIAIVISPSLRRRRRMTGIDIRHRPPSPRPDPHGGFGGQARSAAASSRQAIPARLQRGKPFRRGATQQGHDLRRHS
jgi:hypothetical protein